MNQCLAFAGRTVQGHYRLLAPSKSKAGEFNEVLVSKDGARLSCSCFAANRHRLRKDGRLIVPRAEVLAGTVDGLCWHLRRAAEWSPGMQPVSGVYGPPYIEAPAEPFAFTVADMRRIARLIRRAGHEARVRRLRVNFEGEPERWAHLLCYEVDRHSGEWDPAEHDEWAAYAFLRAVEDMGFNTGAETRGLPGERGYLARAFRREDPNDEAAQGVGKSRTAAAAALAFAIERQTRPWRYSSRLGLYRLSSWEMDR